MCQQRQEILTGPLSIDRKAIPVLCPVRGSTAPHPSTGWPGQPAPQPCGLPGTSTVWARCRTSPSPKTCAVVMSLGMASPGSPSYPRRHSMSSRKVGQPPCGHRAFPRGQARALPSQDGRQGIWAHLNSQSRWHAFRVVCPPPECLDPPHRAAGRPFYPKWDSFIGQKGTAPSAHRDAPTREGSPIYI
jgi:hypothetical protein